MKALYAGSFDPFTIGHLSIAKRALQLFDSLLIGVGFNESKKPEWPIEERIKAISDVFAGNENVEIMAYEGLTARFAKSKGAHVLIRGIRNGMDFEKEKELADINLKVLDIPTVFLPGDPDLSYVSSSMVRELIHNGFNPKEFIAGNFKLPEKLNKI